MKQIEAIIFDWAGTTVDYGCMAPIYAMQEAFIAFNLSITLDEIRKPMGMLKLDHIKTVLAMERVRAHFHATHNRYPESQDIEKIYIEFEKNIFLNLHQHTKLIPGILIVQDYLRAHKINIGTTTGYTKEMIKIVAESAKKQGYSPDYIISSDEVSRGRPYPYMLHQNIRELGIQDVRNVIKVGDTIVDIQEGLYAGCWSVGVIKGSSLLGLNENETASMPTKELKKKIKTIRYQMLAAGAHFVLDSIEELPSVIELIQQKLPHLQNASLTKSCATPVL
jgi:phosphonoacetaldehyde hydrolase